MKSTQSPPTAHACATNQPHAPYVSCTPTRTRQRRHAHVHVIGVRRHDARPEGPIVKDEPVPDAGTIAKRVHVDFDFGCAAQTPSVQPGIVERNHAHRAARNANRLARAEWWRRLRRTRRRWRRYVARIQHTEALYERRRAIAVAANAVESEFYHQRKLQSEVLRVGTV